MCANEKVKILAANGLVCSKIDVDSQQDVIRWLHANFCFKVKEKKAATVGKDSTEEETESTSDHGSPVHNKNHVEFKEEINVIVVDTEKEVKEAVPHPAKVNFNYPEVSKFLFEIILFVGYLNKTKTNNFTGQL